MNEHQAAAYANPCFEAEETGNSAFHWYVREGARVFSVILTANVGLE